MSYADVYSQVHAWVVGITGYDTDHVIPSDDTGPRPSVPYITIGVLTHDLPIGQTDEVLLSCDGVLLKETQRGARRATVSIQEVLPSASRHTSPQIERLALTLELASTALLLTAIDVESIGAVRRIPARLGSSIEMRYAVDVVVVYSDSTTPAIVPDVETIEVDATWSGQPDDLTDTITVTT